MPNLSKQEFLEKILISNNQILNIDSLSDYKNNILKELDLSTNKISFINYLTFESLEVLTLHNNLIENIFEFNCPKLKILEIRKNKIAKLSFLKGTPKLEELYMAENQIESLNDIPQLKFLSHLHLRANKIKDVTYFIIPKSLIYLNLRSNLIEDAQHFLNLINPSKELKLEKLNYLENPFTDLKNINIQLEIFEKTNILLINKEGRNFNE